MQSSREIERLLIGTLLVLGLIGGITAYWAVLGSETIVEREDNPRRVEKRASILRGDIVDRNGVVLVASTPGDDIYTAREYLYPSLYSALGYYSFRYGEGGAESAYNAILNGDARSHDLGDFLHESLLHLPREGADIRLSFDLTLQNRVGELMEGYQGAVVALSVPDGAVLALLSSPTYNPNTLDNDWETLIQDEGKPFFNRVLQGNYQPGGSAYTLLIAAALLNNIPLDTPYPNARDSVQLTDVTLECALTPPADTLTLAEAYRYGCPAPFVQLIEQIGLEQVAATFDRFYPDPPITLPGFITEPVAEAIAEVTPEATIEPETAFTLADALGQGKPIFSPIQLAAITAAILNNGNLTQPYTLLATRPPGNAEWISADAPNATISLFAPEIAQQLNDLLRQTTATGNAQSATSPGLVIGGQTALAYSGEGTHVWFTGFVQTGNQTSVAVTVVIENSANYNLAASIGGNVLQAATHAQ